MTPPRSEESRPPAGSLAAGALGAGVGDTITAGMLFEGPAGLALGAADDAGTMTPGSRPVEPRTGARRPSSLALEDGAGAAEGAAEAVGVTMIPGSRPVEPRTGARMPSSLALEDGADAGEGAGEGVGVTMTAGRPADDGAEDLTGAASDGAAAEGVGCTAGAADDAGTIIPGSRPVDPRIGARRPSLLALEEGACSGDGVGDTTTAGTPADEGPRDGLDGTTSGVSLFAGEGLLMASELRPPLELDAGAGDDGCSSSGVETTGTGVARRFPVPGCDSGTGVTMISWMEVTVLGCAPASLLLTNTFVVASLASELELDSENTWLRNWEKSNFRDSSCEEDESEDEVDEACDVVVGAAGAVVLVTIWRLMCRGK
jgi:hypothetical protein